MQWVRGNEILEVKSGETEIIKHTTDDQTKQVCDVGALTPISYTLYFLHIHVVMGFLYHRGKGQKILKTDVCGNHVEEIFPSQGTTIS